MNTPTTTETGAERFALVRDGAEAIVRAGATVDGRATEVIAQATPDRPDQPLRPLYTFIDDTQTVILGANAETKTLCAASRTLRLLYAARLANTARASANAHPWHDRSLDVTDAATLLASAVPGASIDALCATLCHDVLEGSSLGTAMVEDVIGHRATAMVIHMTPGHEESGPRHQRDAERMKSAEADTQLVMASVTIARAAQAFFSSNPARDDTMARAAIVMNAARPLPAALERHAQAVIGMDMLERMRDAERTKQSG